MSRKISFNLLALCMGFLALWGGLFLYINEVKAVSTSSSSASVTNVLPVASGSSINAAAASVTLSAGTTVVVTDTFTVTDNNGCSDIDVNALKTKAVLYRTNFAGGAACTPGDASCYTMVCAQDGGTCTAGGADLTATYTCTASVQYYADATDATSVNAATDWTATAIPRDAAGTDGTTNADTIEFNSLIGMTVTSTIAYGALALSGNTGSTDQTTIVTNTGNHQMDVQMDAYGAAPADNLALTCTIGSVAVGQERNRLASGVAWSSKAPLTSTASTSNDFNLNQGLASTKNVYWGLGLPATGVGGSCTGTVEFTPISS